MTHVHQIKLRISNCYLVAGESLVLVDTGSPGEGQKILKAVRRLGYDPGNISLIVHTHGHPDHCGSTRELANSLKIPTAIHSLDRHMAIRGVGDRVTPVRWMASIIKPFVVVPFPPFEPDILIDQFTDWHSFGFNARMHHTPGHTKGSVSVELDNQEAIIGDVVMGGYLGVFLPGKPDFHYFVEDFSAIHHSIRYLLKLQCTKYHVGHGGPLLHAAMEKRFSDLLRTDQ
jgi:glyoxylase-like metal-dependent hydrolase (beta-lactamase superfamily II)